MKLFVELEKEHFLNLQIVKNLELMCKSELSSLSQEGKINLAWNIKQFLENIDDMKTNCMLLIKRNISDQVDKTDIDKWDSDWVKINSTAT